MKTVVITGGAGFIGSHLCDYFLEKGYRVICVDNLITGKEVNISHLKKHPHFTYLNHDVSTPLHFDERIDYVLHFASLASPKAYQLYPIQTLKVGALGTHNTLGLAKKHQATYLLASTSEVYGDPLVHPQPETYWGNVNPIRVRRCYDESKRFAEALVMAYHRTHHLDTKIARIFNTYGPRMAIDDGRVVPAFLMQVIRGKPLTVYGDGSQTRSFCYIKDLTEGLHKLLLSSEHEPVNLGNPAEMTIKQFAEKILAITQSPSKIVFEELPLDDPKIRQPDITKAIKLLGWKPSVPVEEGLMETYDWFRAHAPSR